MHGLSLKFRYSYLYLWVLSLFSIPLVGQSYPVGDHFAEIGEVKLHFSVRGAGPYLVVGHPNSGKIGYQLSLQPLEAVFTVVYYDPRGTGQSSAPAALNGYHQAELVDEIEALRKELKAEQFWLFGHSDQSAVALEYALRYPTSTAGLLLTGTSLIGDQSASILRRKQTEQQRAAESPWFAQILADWDYMDKHQTRFDATGRDISTAPLKWWCYDEASFQKVWPIAQAIAQAGRRKPIGEAYYSESDVQRARYLDYQAKIDQLQLPVLLLNGRYDTNNPPQAVEALARKIPHAFLVIVEQAGHFPWVEQPVIAFEAILRWCSKQGLSSKNR